MVLTRYQAALAQFLGRSPQYSDDDEVVFSNNAQHNAQQGDDKESVATQSHETIDMAEDGGERLEAVELAVREMNSKFDSLLAAVKGPSVQALHSAQTEQAGPVPASRYGPASPAAHQAPAHPLHTRRAPLLQTGLPTLPPGFPTPQGLRGPSYDEYVLEQLRREEFFGPRTDDGKGLQLTSSIRH